MQVVTTGPRVVVVSAGEFGQTLSFRGAPVEQVRHHGRGHQVVGRPAQKEDGRRQLARFPPGIEPVLVEPGGNHLDGAKVENGPGHVRHGGERVLHHQSSHLVPVFRFRAEVDGHRAAQGPTEHQDLGRVDVPARRQVVEGGLGVQAEALFGGAAVGKAVAAVLQQADVEAELDRQAFDVEEAVADVAGVPVQEEEGGARRGLAGVLDEKEVEAGPVEALDVEALEGEADGRGGRHVRPRRPRLVRMVEQSIARAIQQTCNINWRKNRSARRSAEIGVWTYRSTRRGRVRRRKGRRTATTAGRRRRRPPRRRPKT